MKNIQGHKIVNHTYQGFTLVELSIVLVIIGLLIGGILVGQSLIQSAKLNKFVTQIGEFDISYRLFKSKYKKAPGDSPLFTPAGDGDGFIESTPMNANTIDYSSTSFTYEVANYWLHLQQSGFSSNKAPFSNDATSGINNLKSNVPTTRFAISDAGNESDIVLGTTKG